MSTWGTAWCCWPGCVLARARGIRLSFLSEFCASPGPEHQHFLVISYPGIQMERLRHTLRELAALLH